MDISKSAEKTNSQVRRQCAGELVEAGRERERAFIKHMAVWQRSPSLQSSPALMIGAPKVSRGCSHRQVSTRNCR